MPTTETRPPRQDRSRRTQEQILDAAERLLRDRPWESIPIVDITREAGCSNGAVYGRFKGKDELLTALYERHDARLRARFARQHATARATGVSLRGFLTDQIGQLIRNTRKDRWLLRAMGLLSRMKPDLVTPEMRRERKTVLAGITAQFAGFEDVIPEVDRQRRIELCVFFITTIVREVILYPGPHADTVKLTGRELEAALLRMGLGYLGVDEAAAAAPLGRAARERNTKGRAGRPRPQ